MPTNPLRQFSSYRTTHILAAYKTLDDAEASNLNATIGESGEQISGNKCGDSGIVIVNEFRDFTFRINSVVTEFSYYSEASPLTSSYGGKIHIADDASGLFSTFMVDVSNRLGVSISNLFFVWRPFFVGNNPASSAEEDSVVLVNPLIFNIKNIFQSFDPANLSRAYIIDFVATYNTTAQLPNYSNMYNFTITSANGNLNNEQPKKISVAGQQTTQTNNATLSSLRKQKLDKSPPMKTLNELMRGLEAELNNANDPHNIQLQNFISDINDNYEKRLTGVIPTESRMNIKYKVELDQEYTNYSIDNRNLPFEQPEVQQDKSGIRAFPINNGESMQKIIDKIMYLSKQIGTDVTNSPPNIFRHNSSIGKNCNGDMTVNTIIKKTVSPQNFPEDIDTGPGNGSINELSYTYQDPVRDDIESIGLMIKTSIDGRNKIIDNIPDNSNQKANYGNREHVTLERSLLDTNIPFDQFGYSGILGASANQNFNGLEHQDAATALYHFVTPVNMIQGTFYYVNVTGNPYILNDINRIPADVVNKNSDTQVYFAFPEYEPMYIKLTIFIDAENRKHGASDDENSTLAIDYQKYYYSGFVHLYKIITTISGSNMTHELHTLRSDFTL